VQQRLSGSEANSHDQLLDLHQGDGGDSASDLSNAAYRQLGGTHYLLAIPIQLCARGNLLTNSTQFPHLIVPIDSQNPNKAYGTSYNGSASGSQSSIFNFDIPASDAGKTCSLEYVHSPRPSLSRTADANA